MTLSLIQLSSLADALAAQALSAKVLAPFAMPASEQHLRNVRTLHAQIGELLAIPVTPAPVAFDGEDRSSEVA